MKTNDERKLELFKQCEENDFTKLIEKLFDDAVKKCQNFVEFDYRTLTENQIGQLANISSVYANKGYHVKYTANGIRIEIK